VLSLGSVGSGGILIGVKLTGQLSYFMSMEIQTVKGKSFANHRWFLCAVILSFGANLHW
jgi:hypothetical protein